MYLAVSCVRSSQHTCSKTTTAARRSTGARQASVTTPVLFGASVVLVVSENTNTNYKFVRGDGKRGDSIFQNISIDCTWISIVNGIFFLHHRKYDYAIYNCSLGVWENLHIFIVVI